ncbi:hypothetical protein [uncultured Sulfitobacter sp.]|uniref:hypothetical protein n=1 Tax=uncultured Sulfitobacter sp. TaxID=191468 RepID=UPI00260FDC70|nr:hypothetical protein [uncultured Sulfitobacter sp.]
MSTFEKYVLLSALFGRKRFHQVSGAALFHKFGDKLAHFVVGLPGQACVGNCSYLVLRKHDETARQGDGFYEQAPVNMPYPLPGTAI